MRVLSMQGKEVWEILQRDRIYHASPDKSAKIVIILKTEKL